MKQRKKFLQLSVCVVLALSCLAAGCEKTDHTHIFSADWTMNETYHWHAAACGHTAETAGLTEHEFADGVCTVCGYEYVPPHVHQLQSVESDEYRHWGYCNACQREVNERHHWQNNTCTVCEYSAGGSGGLLWREDGVLIGAENVAEVIIPAMYNGMPVTEIGEGAFEGHTGLKRVTFPDGLKEIGANAFSGCTSLEAVKFPRGLTEIGEGAFWGCSALTSVTVPDGITVGMGALGGCTALESISLSLNVLSSKPFGYLFGIKSYEDGVEALQTYPISSNSWESALYVLPSSLKTVSVQGDLPYGAFRNCKTLENIVLENAVEIGDYAFEGCTGIEEITLPESLEKVGDCAFSNCTGLASVFIGRRVTFLGKNAFKGCENLQTVVFEHPLGWWYASSISATIGNVLEFNENNVTAFLTETYCNYYWKRL